MSRGRGGVREPLGRRWRCPGASGGRGVVEASGQVSGGLFLAHCRGSWIRRERGLFPGGDTHRPLPLEKKLCLTPHSQVGRLAEDHLEGGRSGACYTARRKRFPPRRCFSGFLPRRACGGRGPSLLLAENASIPSGHPGTPGSAFRRAGSALQKPQAGGEGGILSPPPTASPAHPSTHRTGVGLAGWLTERRLCWGVLVMGTGSVRAAQGALQGLSREGVSSSQHLPPTSFGSWGYLHARCAGPAAAPPQSVGAPPKLLGALPQGPLHCLHRLCRGLGEGGVCPSPLGDTTWGSYSCH